MLLVQAEPLGMEVEPGEVREGAAARRHVLLDPAAESLLGRRLVVKDGALGALRKLAHDGDPRVALKKDSVTPIFFSYKGM